MLRRGAANADGNLPERSQLPAVDDGDYDAVHEDALGGIDVRQMLAAVYRNRFIVAGIVALAVLAGVAVTLLTTPIYEATASVQIEQQATTLLENSELDPVTPVGDTDRFLQTQASVLNSRALGERVADALKLDRDDRFIVAMGEKPPTSTGRQLVVDRQHKVLQILQTNLKVALPQKSRVATITFQSPDRALAARVANSYADNYILSNLDRRVDSSAYARKFLQSQIAETKQRLEESEQALLGYAREAGLIDAGGSGAEASNPTLTLPASNLRDVNTAYASTRTKRVEAEERWRAAQATPLLSLPEVMSSPIILPLFQQRATHVASLAELRARYSADHPSVVQLNRQIAAIDGEIRKQATAIRDGIRDSFTVLRDQEAALEANVEQLRGAALNEQGRRVRYNILKREVDTNRTLYDALLQRYKQLAATAGASINNISVIDNAEPPRKPVKPNMLLNLALAIVGGLVVAGLVVFLREMLDDVVRTPEEVNRKLGLALLGTTPLLPKGSSPAAELQDPRSPMSEAYHSLRTAISFSSPDGAPESLLFTSSQPAEGKTTSAIAVAHSFSRLGRRVLLVDADLRNPSLHKYLGLKSNMGLVDVLTGQKSLHEVVQMTEAPNLELVSCGPLPPNPTDLLASEALLRLLAEARETYSIVIIDGPPVIGLADAPLIARATDAVAFVIETGLAHRGQAKAAIRRLGSTRANVIGVILTKFDARSAGYGYGYGYGYSYNYTYGEKVNA